MLIWYSGKITAYLIILQRQARQGGQDKVELQGQVAKGVIPGVPGKDYPVNSVDALKKKNPASFSNLKPAPAHLITPGTRQDPVGP